MVIPVPVATFVSKLITCILGVFFKNLSRISKFDIFADHLFLLCIGTERKYNISIKLKYYGGNQNQSCFPILKAQ